MVGADADIAVHAVDSKYYKVQTQGVMRERMLREMGEAIDVVTAERPLVLWLEDIHWSDDPRR